MTVPKPSGTGTPDEGKFARDSARVARGFWPKLRRIAAKLPFLDQLVAAYYCALDPKTPFKVRAILMAALAYFVMPVDFVPDFIAAFGYADDATVLYGAIKAVAQHITPAHREKAAKAIEKMSA